MKPYALKTELLGKHVKVISDNENYDSFRRKTLIITRVAKSVNEHPGYDTCIYPQLLCDFKDLEGNEIKFSLYEYEFKVITHENTSKTGKTCLYCGHRIYYSRYHKSYRCMCDRAAISVTEFKNNVKEPL